MANMWIIRPLPIIGAVASSTAPGRDPSYVGVDPMGVVWMSGAVANPTLDIDLGADTAIDTVALLGLTGAQAGWQLSVKAATAAQGASFPGGSYADGPQDLLAGSAMPTSGRGVGLWAPPTPPALTRYMRFTVNQGSTAPVTIGRIVAGNRIQLARNFSFGAALGVKDMSKVDVSRRGALIRSRGKILRSVKLRFTAAHKDEVEAALLPLQEIVGNSELITIVTDPAPHEMRQRRVYHGLLQGDLEAIWSRADGFEWNANLLSFI